MKALKAIFKLARPRQWVKNIFVFPVLIFSGLFVHAESTILTLLAFASFCLASSGAYYLNDYKDIEDDRKHPIKRNRPLASGALPPWAGLAGSVALFACAIGLPILAINPPTTVIICFYIMLNIFYSLGLKHVVIIDVLVIATGFVLRILAGAAALFIMPSPWLVLCAVMLSLFLGFTKRRSEVVNLGEKAIEHRRVLADYSTAFLDQMISIVTASTVVGYVLYTVDSRTTTLVGSRALLLSVPFVLYCVFRYLYLVYHVASEDGDHTRTIFTDIPMLVSGAIWGILCMAIIVYGKEIGALFL